MENKNLLPLATLILSLMLSIDSSGGFLWFKKKKKTKTPKIERVESHRDNLNFVPSYLKNLKELKIKKYNSFGKKAGKFKSCKSDSLNIGESVVFKNSYMGTPLRGNYKLTRLSHLSYLVTLNYAFDTEPGVPISEIEKAREKTKNSFEIYSKLFKLKTGESIQLKLYEPGMSSPPPPKIKITIGNYERGHYQNWKINFDETYIIHETMHHLGLVDEYKEKGKDRKPGNYFDCRVIGPLKNSILNAHSETLDNDYKVNYCYCTAKHRYEQIDPSTLPFSRDEYYESCNYYLKEKLKYSGLENLAHKDQNPYYDIKCNEKSIQAPSIDALKDKVQLSELNIPVSIKLVKDFKNKNDEIPVFHPAHFRAIISPSCYSNNRDYYICSSQAYFTSPSKGGSQTCSDSIKSYCNGKNWLD